MSDSLILVFVKHPEVGKVKTRLAKTIGHEAALAIYRSLLEYTKGLVLQLEVDTCVFYGNMIPDTDLWKEASFNRKLQYGEDLGARMNEAFSWAFGEGYKKVVIIGSDCAELTVEILEKAFERLEKYEYVIGPAKDGGYYLLGMKALLPSLFKHKAWSTDTVFTDTIEDLEASSKPFICLPTLSDIDTEEDLKGTFLEKML